MVQSSFQFFVGDDDWKEDRETGAYIRTIKKVERLLDVAPVTFPAYQNTTVSKRALDTVEKLKQPDNTWQIESEARKRQIEFLTLTK